MLRRTALIVALVGCEAPAPPPPGPPPPARAPVLRIGRGQPVTILPAVAIAGRDRDVLQLPTVWQVPGAARAVIYGTVGDHEVAIELVDIDRGIVVWRDRKTCAGPLVGVTETRAICADAKGTHALDLATGAVDWETTEPFVAIDGDRVAIAGIGAISIRGAGDGDELAHVALPPGVLGTSVLATCSVHEVFGLDPDGKLLRIVDAPPGAKTRTIAAWALPARELVKLEPCSGASVLVATREPGGLEQLAAYARDTGKPTATIAGVTGWWPARDGSDRIEVATALGVASYRRDLATSEPTALPPLGELLASRGERRLVRATPLTAALVDLGGVRAYLPFGELGGALGDTAMVAASWQGTASETVHRRLLPTAQGPRPTATPPLPARVPLAPAAELRDLPEPIALDESRAIAHPGSALAAVADVALDPADPTALYALAIEREIDDLTGGGVARADLAAGAWRWHRADGCGNGAPIGLAVTHAAIACGARTSRGAASVRATTRDGVRAWDWRGDGLDTIAGGGDLVALGAGDRLTLLDARDGRTLGELASDDGTAVRAAIVARGDQTWLASYERGAIALRQPLANMAPSDTIEVAGVVRALLASGDGIVVELEDGDGYRIELRGPHARAIPALGMAFRASGELVTAQGPGGALYGAARPVVVARPLPVLPSRPPALPVEGAPLSTPVPMPPIVGSAWQYALFALDGGLVARNDYALAPPIVPVAARAPMAPLVVTHGEAGSRIALVLDARTGDPLRRVRLPDAAPVFATVVDGKPIVGIVAATPLRIVSF